MYAKMRNTSSVGWPGRNNLKEGRSEIQQHSGNDQEQRVTDANDSCGNEWSATKSCRFRVGADLYNSPWSCRDVHRTGSRGGEGSKQAAVPSRDSNEACRAELEALRCSSGDVCEWKLFWMEDKFSASQVRNHNDNALVSEGENSTSVI